MSYDPAFLTAIHFQVLYQEVIDVDDDEDLSTDVTVPDEKNDSKNKGKAVENGYDGSIGHQMKVYIIFINFKKSG